MLPKVRGYDKCLDKAKYMFFSVKDEELLEAYKRKWNRVSDLMKKKNMVVKDCPIENN